MSTSTEFETAERQAANPDIGDVETDERRALDSPEGRFFFVLESNYGMMESKNGKPYINVRFRLDQEAIYNEDGTLREVVTLQRPRRVWHKFWVGNDYGDTQVATFLTHTIGTPTGTKNPATGRYEYSKVAELNRALEKGAWNQIRHKRDDYGWKIDINREFEAKPRSRVRPTAANGSGT